MNRAIYWISAAPPGPHLVSMDFEINDCEVLPHLHCV
jgi:hypothetical protein